MPPLTAEQIIVMSIKQLQRAYSKLENIESHLNDKDADNIIEALDIIQYIGGELEKLGGAK